MNNWPQVLSDLQLQMTQATFDTWLRGSALKYSDGDTWLIRARHANALPWLDQRLRPVIERNVHRYAPGVAVKFTANGDDPAPAPAPVEEPASATADDDPGEVIFEAVREERVTLRRDGRPLQHEDFYIKLKIAFRKRALRRLKGARLSVFLCLALHVDRDAIAFPGVEAIMRETGYGRATVCSALDDLEKLGLIRKTGQPSRLGTDQYEVRGYAWFGQQPAPALWEEKRMN